MSYPTPPPGLAATLPSLRQSCQFCRRRKIKCSGESTGCRTCVARRQACIFELASPMGRPRKLRDSDSPEELIRVQQRKGGERRRTIESVSGAEVLKRRGKGEDSTPAYSSRKVPKVAGLEVDLALCEGLEKLRVTSIKTTYDGFAEDKVGVMLQAFYGLVSPPPAVSLNSLPTPSSSPDDEPTHPSLRVPKETRALYESRFQSLPPRRAPRSSTVKLAKEAATKELWGWLGSEIVGLATGKGREGERCFLLRLLEEDQSEPFAVGCEVHTTSHSPLDSISPADTRALLYHWFQHSPFSYLLNDAYLLTSYTNGTLSPLLLSVLLCISLSLPSPPPISTHTLPTSEVLHQHALALLLALPAAEAASNLGMIQAILLLAVHLGTRHRIRQAWAVMACGYALAREMLKRVERGRGEVRSEREKAEEEALRGTLWTFAIFGSWAFLSLDLPRSTLVDVTDSLALPPFEYQSSLAHTFREQRIKFDAVTPSLYATHSSFAQTTRLLSLVVSLSLPVLPPPHSPSPSPNPSSLYSAPFPIGDPRLARMPAFAVSTAGWLLGLGERWLAEAEPTPGEGMGEVQSPLLGAVCAVLAMSRLSPPEEEEERVGESLQVQGWRMVLGAVEGLVRSVAREGEGRRSDGSPLEAEEREEHGMGTRRMSGVQRVVLAALPRSLALLSRLLQLSGTSPTMHTLVASEHTRISLLQANLIALSHRPSALPQASPSPAHSEQSFPLPSAPFLNRSNTASTTSASESAESLYTLASKVTASAEGGFARSPLTYSSPHPLPAQTDGMSPSAFILSLPPPTTSLFNSTKPTPFPLVLASHHGLSLEPAAAALTLPSPPQEEIEERWKKVENEKSLMSPLEMIRKVLGKGKRGAKRRR